MEKNYLGDPVFCPLCGATPREVRLERASKGLCTRLTCMNGHEWTEARVRLPFCVD